MLASSASTGGLQLLQLLRRVDFTPARRSPVLGTSIGSLDGWRAAAFNTGAGPSAPSPPPPPQKEVIYKGRWILPFRLLVRAKVFQLIAASGAAVAATTVFFKEDATTLEIAGVSALGAGCIVASVSLWYFSRRYVGELSLLLPDRTTARFSVLDFWGNREDVDVPIDHIQPPFKDKHPLVVRRIANQMAFPLTVKDERQFFLSVGGGEATDKETLMKLLRGQLHTEPPLAELQRKAPEKTAVP